MMNQPSLLIPNHEDSIKYHRDRMELKEKYYGQQRFSYLVSRTHGDLWKPRAIVIKQKTDEILIKHIDLIIGGSVMARFDWNICQKLKYSPSVSENQKIYSIPWEKFFGQMTIPLISLQYHEVRIEIYCYKDKLSDNLEVTLLSTSWKSPRRLTISRTKHDLIPYQITRVDQINFYRDEYLKEVEFKKIDCLQGFYIEGDIKALHLFRLTDDENNVQFETMEPLKKSRIISKNLIFLPCKTKDEIPLKPEMWWASLPDQRDGSWTLTIGGHPPLNSFKIYPVNWYCLRVMSGMAGTMPLFDLYDADNPTRPKQVDSLMMKITETIEKPTEEFCYFTLEQIPRESGYVVCFHCQQHYNFHLIAMYLELENIDKDRNIPKCPVCQETITFETMYLNQKIDQNKGDHERDELIP